LLSRERISTCVCCCGCWYRCWVFPSAAVLLVGYCTLSVNVRWALILSFVIYMILLLLSSDEESYRV
jgi:cytochrome c oxidase subunit IV